MSTFLRSLLAIGLLLGVASLTVPAQQVSDPLCGTLIREDLVLDHDVICYNTNGPAIGAEGITIDLNGKAIRCRNGNSPDCHGSGAIGIDASRVGYIAIQGPGTIVGFDVQFVSGAAVPRYTSTATAPLRSRRLVSGKSKTADFKPAASSKSRTDTTSN